MSLSRFYDVLRAQDGSRYIESYVTGFQLLHLPLLNKGTAFTEEERTLLGLHGLLPPRIDTLERQIDRNYQRFLSQGARLSSTRSCGCCRTPTRSCSSPSCSSIWRRCCPSSTPDSR